MQQMFVMPVANGILPRPDGGSITGMFIRELGGQILYDVGVGRDILICPWLVDDEALYPVGVIARIIDISIQTTVGDGGTETEIILARLEGRDHARWRTLKTVKNYLFSLDVETLNLKKMRKEYPSISGAGWVLSGGYTEFRGKYDIPVTLYGTDLESGQETSITANLGGLVEQEQAHTIEHAIIRALKVYGLCTVKTLLDSMRRETTELKSSVENSIKYNMPEFLGITASGSCGNPMTNLAKFYLTQNFIKNLSAGKSLNESLIKARTVAMSKLTQDLGLTMQPGIRTLQGLKKGMSHDDTPLKIDLCKKVIGRFPFHPWG